MCVVKGDALLTVMKTADSILSANFHDFAAILSDPNQGNLESSSPSFLGFLVDRYIQEHPPNFGAAAKKELEDNVRHRYPAQVIPPSDVLAALHLMRVLGDKPSHALATYICHTGPALTRDEDACLSYLQNRPHNIQMSEEQVSFALMYTTISQTHVYNPSILVAALRRLLPATFQWKDVCSYFDQPKARITPQQFMRLYEALLPIARDEAAEFDIQRLWGGNWDNPDTHLSFICAFTSLAGQLDASTIPGLRTSFTWDDYARSKPVVRDRAAAALKHPLVSVVALEAIFHVALHSQHASQDLEARRLFEDVVLPNLDIFLVSAFGVPKEWPRMAVDTLTTIFESFLLQRQPHYEFVMDSLWRMDKEWVKKRLIDTHAAKSTDVLPILLDHAVNFGWLDELVDMCNGLSFDLAALAHAEGLFDLVKWANQDRERTREISRNILRFTEIKAEREQLFQRPPEGQPPVKDSYPLQVKSVVALLNIIEEFVPQNMMPEVVRCQRLCITNYPRLVNYGEGYDDIIDANGKKDGNALPPAAIQRMEEHFKKMYSGENQVRDVVDALKKYKHSRDPLDQDVFACMIHSLFDEYGVYTGYPLEALATTAVLFGGIVSHKLVSGLPLKVGLGMILEAVRDHAPQDPMYKFGLQALKQFLPRLREWPGFCHELVQVPGLRGTDVWKRADEIVRNHEEEQGRGHGNAPRGGGANGSSEEASGVPETKAPPFTAVRAYPPPAGAHFEDPSPEVRGKIQFVLNNLTQTTLQAMFKELRELLEDKHQQWFASHLVEERAKMQPNYHSVYLELVDMFGDKSLWSEVTRETFVSVARMLNSETTMTNATERAHLKNLGGWLGMLTLARDKPIKAKNIAFKQLLIEGHDTKRLIVVIPFVCKVLLACEKSTIFKPPNPWLMDIIQLLIEIYHTSDIKLNQKFEIEVLCNALNLDYKTIEPSSEILNRTPVEEPVEAALGGQDVQQQLENFENLSINGAAAAAAASSGLGHASPAVIPDLGPLIQIPPLNEMIVSSARLHEIVRAALTRALEDIIQPVVERSVTIAAISTQQIVRKDFATEPDENRLRSSAISMVKATAGSLALVTSRDPLKASFTNYLRNLSAELPQGLPEGTIMMCSNLNLDLACGIVEKQAEERAVPEIEKMLEEDIEARRRHRLHRPNEPFFDPSLSRWALAIPNPYKLSPNMNGLNAEQMAIYEDFARQPRTAAAAAAAGTSGPSHIASTSDASRSLANEVLQDQYSSVSNIPTPAETPAISHVSAQQIQPYQTAPASLANGRLPGFQMDARRLADKVSERLNNLQREATEASEQHFSELPRGHLVLNLVDSVIQECIRMNQSEDFTLFVAEQICAHLFSNLQDNLAIEALVHVLEALRKISGPGVNARVVAIFRQQPGATYLNINLINALIRTDLLDWQTVDQAVAHTLAQRQDGAIKFFENLLEATLLNDRPIALYADFIQSLEAAWQWLSDEPEAPGAQSLKEKLLGSGLPVPAGGAGVVAEAGVSSSADQMEYVFEEWVHLSSNPNTSEKAALIFIQQLHARRVVTSKDDFMVFVRAAIDVSVDRFEMALQTTGNLTEAYVPIDALAKLIIVFVRATNGEEPENGRSLRASFLETVLSVVTIVMYSHHTKLGENFSQKVFFRLVSMLLHELHAIWELLPAADVRDIPLAFARRFVDMSPAVFPGFAYGYMGLLQHRVFLPMMMRMADGAGWDPYTVLLKSLLDYLGDQLNALEVANVAKDIYRATLKLLLVLQHDYPDYMSAKQISLTQSIPPHCSQLLNLLLVAAPPPRADKIAEPFYAGVSGVGSDGSNSPNAEAAALVRLLRQTGLREILDQSLKNGPSEDAIAHIVHAFGRPAEGQQFRRFGHVPVQLNLPLMEAVTYYVADHGVRSASGAAAAGQAFDPQSTNFRIISLLTHELPPEARYRLLVIMVNQLRYPQSYTTYFAQMVLEFFVGDEGDQEDADIRQQIVRIFFERTIGYWPQPFGLIITIADLVKNEKYHFYDLPCVKAAPEVSHCCTRAFVSVTCGC